MSDAAQGTQGGFDIATTTSVAELEDAGQWVELRNEHGNPLTYGADQRPVRMRVAGTYSKRFRRIRREQQERHVRQRTTRLTGEQLEDNAIELVAGCVMEWEGFVNAGAPYACTKENATNLLRRAPWFREQVEQAMDDHASFSRASSES